MGAGDPGAEAQTSPPGWLRRWWKQVLLVPRVAWLTRTAPRDARLGFEQYWERVRTTGLGGDVLWDTGDLNEVPQYLSLMREHFDLSLPLIDVGCGNGRFARRLAPAFRTAWGTDFSANAIARAKEESRELPHLKFRVLDATDPAAAKALRAEVGEDANVFVRGMFHVMKDADQARAAQSLLSLVGRRGRVLLAETNYQGGNLGYLQSLGATAQGIPAPLERALASLPAPRRFGAPERARCFPPKSWSLVHEGEMTIETIPLASPEPCRIPGYVALLAPRS